MAQLVEVAAGLICHDGRYLIAKRRAGVHLAGMWEFPGRDPRGMPAAGTLRGIEHPNRHPRSVPDHPA
jgi:hypothetical protein